MNDLQYNPGGKTSIPRPYSVALLSAGLEAPYPQGTMYPRLYIHLEM